jgi:hypothetical protein
MSQTVYSLLLPYDPPKGISLLPRCVQSRDEATPGLMQMLEQMWTCFSECNGKVESRKQRWMAAVLPSNKRVLAD